MPSSGIPELIEDIVTKDPVARKVAAAAKIDQQLAAAGISSVGLDLSLAALAGQIGWEFIANNLAVEKNIAIGGALVAGSTRLDQTGLSLADAANDAGTYPAAGSLSDWIVFGLTGGAPLPASGIGGFNDTVSDERGMSIVASGILSGAREGLIVLRSDIGGQDTLAQSTSKIRIKSAKGGTGTVKVQGEVSLAIDTFSRWIGQYELGSTTVNAGVSASWSHGLGVIPRRIIAQMRNVGDASYRALAIGIDGAANAVEVRATTGTLTVVNNTATNKEVRVTLER